MIKIAVFSDFHYKKRMYPVRISDFQKILDRAKDNNVDFILHGGDFCNDYAGSPELIDLYLNNPYGLPVYGVYGNHELETEGNTMANVTPCLCNRPVNFAFEGAAHWYTDLSDKLRLIGVDTNYYYWEEDQSWHHVQPARVGPPKGSLYGCTLGPDQFAWLESLIADACEKGMKVIVTSHMAFGGDCWKCGDAQKVSEMFAKYPNTVILCVSGHLHTDHFSVVNNIAYFDVNATRNAFWKRMENFHYSDDQTFEFHDYDKDGKEIGVSQMKLNDLYQGKNNWAVNEPLSSILTIDDDGTITIEGSKTDWMYGVLPPIEFPHPCIMPEIRSRKAKIEL